jgi:serine/threonine-protein kinase
MSFGGNALVCPTCDRSFSEGSKICPYDSSPLRVEPTTLDEDPLLGTAIDGKFTIRRRLGSGGMGVVYAAVQHSLDRVVALKVLAPRLNPDRRADQRFRVEARAASLLRSPHAVKVHDFGITEQGLLYLAMELVEGDSLRSRMKEGPLPLREAITIAAQIADALAEAHSREPQIIHRDVKPDNVMLRTTRDGTVFAIVLDFGLALLTDDPRLTASHTIVGTVAYMAPERLIEGAEIGDRVDVYALGVTLFEMLTGETPFTSPHQLALMQKHLNDAPPPLRDFLPEAPEALEELLLETLAKSAADRPSTADLRSRLLALLDELPRTAPSTTEPTSNARPGPRRASEPINSDPTRRQAAVEWSRGQRTPTPRPGALPVRQRRWPIAVGGAIVLSAVLGGWIALRASRSAGPSSPAIPAFVPAPVAVQATQDKAAPPEPSQPAHGSPSFRATPPVRAGPEGAPQRRARKAEPGAAAPQSASTDGADAAGSDVAGFDQAVLNELKDEGPPK